MTFNIKACEESEEEGILLMLILWVEKITAVLPLVKTSPVDSRINPGPIFSHLVCIVTQLGNPSVRGLNLCGCSAMGAVCLALLACRPAGAFPGSGLVAASSLSSSGFCFAWHPVWRHRVPGTTLGQTDHHYIILFASCYIMYTSGSGHTKPFFLGKSYGLLKVINID